MSVVPFTPGCARDFRSWTWQELQTLISVYDAHAARGDAFTWEVGATELDDPQFYILGGAKPDLDCILAISRFGRTYVLENGAGHVLHEGPSLEVLGARAKAPITRGSSLWGRITVGLAAFRLSVQEKLEAIFVETEEFLLPVVPQLAALV
jgi:hypothetical protein